MMYGVTFAIATICIALRMGAEFLQSFLAQVKMCNTRLISVSSWPAAMLTHVVA